MWVRSAGWGRGHWRGAGRGGDLGLDWNPRKEKQTRTSEREGRQRCTGAVDSSGEVDFFIIIMVESPTQDRLLASTA